jgi:hypothetical protein
MLMPDARYCTGSKHNRSARSFMSKIIEPSGLCAKCIRARVACSIRDEAVILSSCDSFMDWEEKEKELALKMETFIE